jgi:hypothetical protein
VLVGPSLVLGDSFLHLLRRPAFAAHTCDDAELVQLVRDPLRTDPAGVSVPDSLEKRFRDRASGGNEII